MRNATLCFLVDIEKEKVLLGMKKKGFGSGKWNGFGGKIEQNESVEQAALREIFEESNVKPKSMKKAAELTFTFPVKSEWNQIVHVFTSHEWENEPSESDEMLPKWFSFDEIPYNQMWQDDVHWLPKVLDGKNIKATFVFKEDNESIEKMELNEE